MMDESKIKGDYIVLGNEKEEGEPNRIDNPGFEFDSDETAKSGQLVTCRVKKDGEKLCVLEIEGLKMPGYKEEEEE